MREYKVFKPMAPPQRGVIPFYRVLQKTKALVEAGGLIATDDAWKALRLDYTYASISIYFKVLMEQLIAKKMAIRVKMGQYQLAEDILVDDKELAEQYRAQLEKPEKPFKLIEIPELPVSGLTKFSAQDDGKRRVGPFYSKVYGQFINL